MTTAAPMRGHHLAQPGLLRRVADATERAVRHSLWTAGICVWTVAGLSLTIAPSPNEHTDPRLMAWYGELPQDVRHRVRLVEPGTTDTAISLPTKVFAEVRDAFGSAMATAFAIGAWRRSAAAEGGGEYGYAITGPLGRCVIVAPREAYVGWGEEDQNLRFVLDHELGHCLLAAPAWERTSVLEEERKADAFATLRRMSSGDVAGPRRMHRMRMAMALADPDHATADRIEAAMEGWRPGMTVQVMLATAREIAARSR